MSVAEILVPAKTSLYWTSQYIEGYFAVEVDAETSK